jgi:hypothetical protein
MPDRVCGSCLKTDKEVEFTPKAKSCCKACSKKRRDIHYKNRNVQTERPNRVFEKGKGYV